ncbi:class I SAM-dependent methyltransferase [Algoriphagus resistens]|uniref:class I SAM-dependent methyltransferase n=1 Tax=Algoriphagus resistens TaxID=1750590 RepID=UPI000716B351|nr:class I SAM-dependent methyltransferase [Algoriphagus resistens]
MIKNYVKAYLQENISLDETLCLQLSNPSENDFLILKESPGGWSIDKHVAEALMRLVEKNKITRVVEVGAGFSTVVFYYVLSKLGLDYEVFSMEENVDWFKIPTVLEALVNVEALQFHTGDLKFVFGYFGIHATYKILEREKLSPGVELVFIDGPQYYYGREGGLDGIYDKLKVGCLIIMDDTERYTEQCVIYKWLKVYKGLQLIYHNEYFGDKGFSILMVESPLTKQFSLKAYSLGLMQGIKRVTNYRRIIKKQALIKSSIKFNKTV